MKRFLSVLLLAISLPSYGSDLSYPKLYFLYSFLYDNVCSQIPGRQIDPRWSDEVKQRTPELEAMWLAESPQIMGKLFELFNMGFERKEMTASLSVCPKTASFSVPMVLNVTHCLKSFMGDKPTWQSYQFVDEVFHELLHTWIYEHLPPTTPLLEKYRDESFVVKKHLHLMAVQKYVYTELNRQDLLGWIDELYSQTPDKPFNRAWKIVNEIEGYQPFVNELKASAPKK